MDRLNTNTLRLAIILAINAVLVFLVDLEVIDWNERVTNSFHSMVNAVLALVFFFVPSNNGQ